MPTERLPATGSETATILVSFELSQKSWVITLRQPGSAKLSRQTLAAGDTAALAALLRRQRQQAERLHGPGVAIVSIQEAGLDGFWLHRCLRQHGMESHVVDAASIAAPRRKRRPKSDGIDGEILLRVLAERVALGNRIGGLLASQGVRGYKPLRPNRRAALAGLCTGDGRALPRQLDAEIGRMLERLELLLTQIKAVEAERDALLAQAEDSSVPALLLRLRGIGPGFASVLWLECLCRSFANRRQLACFGGLAPTPWRSGGLVREQGVRGGGMPRLRTLMVELAWLWLTHQPGSALSQWDCARTATASHATNGSPSWPWRASCWWRCGAMSMTAWCRKGRC